MRVPSRTYSYSRTTCITTIIVFIATLLAKTFAATLPTPPSPADKWLYPDINTVPTYNYLDIVNASWASNFVAPYLLLRCQHPNDALHYAYPYNQSVSATGSALVPLDDGDAWLCHFEVSDLSTSSANAPMFVSNDFNIVLNDGEKPVLWTNTQDGGGSVASSAASIPTTSSPTTSANSTPTSSISSTTTPPFTTTHFPSSSTFSIPTTASISSSTTTATSSALPPTPTQPSTSPTPSSSSTSTGLSKSKKIAIIVGSTMAALLLVVVAIAVHFILRTRRSERNSVVYRSGPGDGSASKEVPGLEAPRERWKGVEIPRIPSGGRMQGYF